MHSNKAHRDILYMPYYTVDMLFVRLYCAHVFVYVYLYICVTAYSLVHPTALLSKSTSETVEVYIHM